MFEKLENGEVVKLNDENTEIIGTYIGIEESKMYPNSFALKYKDLDNKSKVTFVSNIVNDLLISNQVVIGMPIKVKFIGKKQSSSGLEYNNYEVYVDKTQNQ